jgi:N-acetylmuramoyl-L-alanine amidase
MLRNLASLAALVLVVMAAGTAVGQDGGHGSSQHAGQSLTAVGASDAAAMSSTSELVATTARIAGDATRTRFVVDLTSEIGFAVFPLADPHRIVIDLPQLRFALAPDAGRQGRGLVASWRYGLLAVGKSRVVIDLARAAAVDKAFVLPPVDAQPARLVIDLVAVDEAAFVAEAERARDARTGTRENDGGAAAAAIRQARVRPLIVLDAGHGGIDTGAAGSEGTLEKHITLDFASLLKRKLEGTGLFEVRLTRDDDVFIALDSRMAFARRVAADLFVSIHADAAPQSYVRGATVYTVSERASDADAAAVAAQENRSDVIAGVDLEATPDDVADILIDLARRETKTMSHRAAEAMISAMAGHTMLNSNPHRYAGFRVLRAHDVPSVLLELGYMTNRHDEALMLSEEWRDGTAEAMVTAIRGFFEPRLAASSAVVSAGGASAPGADGTAVAVGSGAPIPGAPPDKVAIEERGDLAAAQR